MNLVAWQKTGAIDYPDLGAQACKKVQKTSQAPLTDHVYMIRLKQMRKLRFEVHHKGIDEKETSEFYLRSVGHTSLLTQSQISRPGKSRSFHTRMPRNGNSI